jgi:cellulose synthase/poly-beta-1,6-N-acetylglucosamine synthase-like glycosyltransferase
MIADRPPLEPTVLYLQRPAGSGDGPVISSDDPSRIATCASCQTLLRPGSRFCRRCRAVQPESLQPDAGSNAVTVAHAGTRAFGIEENAGNTWIGPRCPVCRRRRGIGANFCLYCGAPQPASRWRRPLRLPSRDLSAAQTVTAPQRRFGLVAAAGLVAFLFIAPLAALTLLVALATLLYLGAAIYRLRLFWVTLDTPAQLSVTDDEARAIPDAELPIYTVLVPAYREPEVIAELLAQLDRLEYPRDRLDVKLLLEEDDPQTQRAAAEASPGSYVEIVIVPNGQPKTKPKACNVGLAQARGAFDTVYDAEDLPDPLQLRLSVASYGRCDPQVVCLQAKLSYFNAEQNLITRWFTAEYAMWFSQLLPGLVHQSAPIPLGGTSNHFRRSQLTAVGGWDAFNVTEDADLGIRLHRLGLRTLVLDSTTLEEANSDFVNWVKQRSRWYKGYLQTWLVHMRHPRLLVRELGLGGFIGFNLFVGGTPLIALLNPVFWALTLIWFMAHPPIIAALFPPALYYTGLFCMTVGNLAFYYATIVSARMTRRPSLVLAATLAPAYWAMMSIAAIKALMQLFSVPSFWEKTVHGLDGRTPGLDARPVARSTNAPV